MFIYLCFRKILKNYLIFFWARCSNHRLSQQRSVWCLWLSRRGRILRKPELRRTWKDPLIHCLCGLNKTNLCANQGLLFWPKINREHSHKKQKPFYSLQVRFKQHKTAFDLYILFSHWHQTGFVRLYSFAGRSDN